MQVFVFFNRKMVMCFVPVCKHYSERETCKFFRLPRNKDLREKWIEQLSRENKIPTIHSLVCSCHFINADRNNLPTLFACDESKETRLRYQNKEKQKCNQTSKDSLSADLSSSSQLALSLSFKKRCCSKIFKDHSYCLSERKIKQRYLKELKEEKKSIQQKLKMMNGRVNKLANRIHRLNDVVLDLSKRKLMTDDVCSILEKSFCEVLRDIL